MRRICLTLVRSVWSVRSPRRHLDVEGERLLLHQRLDLLRDLRHDVAERDVVEVERHAAGFDLGQVEDVVDQREQVLRRALNAIQAFFLPRRELAVDPVEHQRRVADERVDRRPQLVRHAGEELRLEPVRLLQLARLPLEPGVLLGEVGGGGLNAVLELARERLELVVEPLVLHLLGEVVQHRHDRQRLAAAVQDFSGDDFDRKLDARVGDMELHLLAPRQRRADGEIRDERRELGVVRLNRRRPLPALAVVGLEQLLGLLVHQDDVGAVVGDENRVGDVLENQVQAVALALRLDLRQPHALHLALELVGGAAEVGHVAQNRDGRSGLAAVPSAELVGQHFEQQVRAFVGVDEIELA